MSFQLMASMMCADYSNLRKEVEALDAGGIDSFHIDIMDGRYVPNYAMSLSVRWIFSLAYMSINMYNMLIFCIYILAKGVINMSSLRFEASRLSARELTLAAAMTAVVFLLTFVPKIPIPLGYAHLGDAGIFLIICLVGKREGILAGCLGSMLADFLGGFALWMGPTLLIKWAMAMTFIKISREGELGSLRSLRTYAALMAACLVMAAAYALFGALLYDSLAAGLASLPGLLLEGAVNILAFCAAAAPLGKHLGHNRQ